MEVCLQNSIKEKNEKMDIHSDLSWQGPDIHARSPDIRRTVTEQKQCVRTRRLRATVPFFFFSDSFSVAVSNKKYIIVKMKCTDKIEVSVSGTSLPKSGGLESILLPMALLRTTQVCWADHSPSPPEHKVWGIFIHSCLTGTQEKYKPGMWLPFLPLLFSGFPFGG